MHLDAEMGPGHNVEEIWVTGGKANDVLRGEGGYDKLLGGVGDDGLVGQFGDDNLQGGAGADIISGNEGDDTLIGGDGQDSLNGGAGRNSVSGGAGNDKITAVGVDRGIDVIDGGVGLDTIVFSYGTATKGFSFDLAALSSATGQTLKNGTLIRNVEAFTLTLGSGADTLDLTGATLQGVNRYYAGVGNDRLIADFSALSNAIVLDQNLEKLTTGTATLIFQSVEIWRITGGIGDDDLQTGAGADILEGGDGDDVIESGAGADRVFGGAGADTLTVLGNARVVVDGGAGDDEISVQFPGANSSIKGGLGLDKLILNLGNTSDVSLSTAALASTPGATLADGALLSSFERFNIQTGVGDDTLIVSLGNFAGENSLNAGTGFNRLVADFSATDQVVGVNYNLTGLSLGDGPTIATIALANFAGAGADILNGGGGDDRIDGFDGFDGGADLISGGAGNDTLRAKTGATVDGGDGVDSLWLIFDGVSAGLNISTAAFATSGGGTVQGTTVRNVEQFDIYGGSGNDTLTVSPSLTAENWFDGRGGADRLVGDFSSLSAALTLTYGETLRVTGQFTLHASVETFEITGGSGNDTLSAGSGTDLLSGGEGNDRLYGGGEGMDTLLGGGGDDTLTGASADTLTGGVGDDIFHLLGANAATQACTITDFTVGEDSFALYMYGFSGNEYGALPTESFCIGSQAADASDRIIYDPTTGKLYSDGDGSGTIAPQYHFATISPGLALSAADFTIV